VKLGLRTDKPFTINIGCFGSCTGISAEDDAFSFAVNSKRHGHSPTGLCFLLPIGAANQSHKERTEQARIAAISQAPSSAGSEIRSMSLDPRRPGWLGRFAG